MTVFDPVANMRFGNRQVLCFLVALSVAAIVLADGRPWPHELSRLKPDPSVVWGELENGFRYAIKPHGSSSGRVSMRFVVSVGSLDEEEEERGLSHFVEHMAFAGTRNYAKGDLGRFFQKLGMDYGGDVTAFTYHDRTVYHLELPRNDRTLVEQSLQVYRDYADGILFEPQNVDVERQVIARERQARDTPQSQLGELALNLALDGTRVPSRSPIGLKSVVENVGPDELRAFYEKWYRPDLMTLVVVGDVDPSAFGKSVSEVFSSIPRPSSPLVEQVVGEPKKLKRLRSEKMKMNGVERFHVEAMRCWSEGKRKDSWKSREEDYLRAFSTALFNERCRHQVRGISTDFAFYRRYLGLPYVSLTVSVGGDEWYHAADWSDYLIRQAHKYGFYSKEIDEMRESWARFNKNQVRRFNTMESHMIIDELVDSIESNRVYLSIEDKSAFEAKMLKKLNRKSLRSAFRECWDYNTMTYLVAGNVAEDVDPDLIASSIHFVRLMDLPRYEFVANEEVELQGSGQVGVVVEEEAIEDLDNAYSIRFANNARLTIMNTDYEPGQSHVLVRVGGGMLGYSGTNPTTHAIAMNAMFRSGFGDNSMENVFAALRTDLEYFGFSASEYDAFEFACAGDVEGLKLFFQILAGYMSEPAINAEAFEVTKTKYKQSRLLDLDGVNEGFRELQRLMFSNRNQFYEPRLDEIEAVLVQESIDWLLPELESGFLEIVVVGDLEKNVVVELLKTTLAALPERKSDKAEFDVARGLELEMPSGQYSIEYDESKGDNAYAVVAWSISDDRVTIREGASMYLLSKILENRINETVRQKLGQSYSPTVNYQTIAAYDKLRFLRADVDCLAEDAESVLALVEEIVDGFLEEGLAEEEIERAVNPLQDSLMAAWLDNEFLANMVLSGMYEYENSVQYALLYREGLLQELSPDEILQTARRLLNEERRLSVALMPSENARGIGEPAIRVIPGRVGVSN